MFNQNLIIFDPNLPEQQPKIKPIDGYCLSTIKTIQCHHCKATPSLDTIIWNQYYYDPDMKKITYCSLCTKCGQACGSTSKRTCQVCDKKINFII